MKPYKLILGLIALINLNTYSQSNFLHRKYTKGVFQEKFHKLKVVEKNNKANLKIEKNNAEVKNEIAEQKPEIILDSATNKKIAVAIFDSIKPNINFSKNSKIDNENNIIKHNTITTNENDFYCSNAKSIIKSNQNFSKINFKENNKKITKSPGDIPGLNLFDNDALEGVGAAILAIIIIGLIIAIIAAAVTAGPEGVLLFILEILIV